jgi:hypothetical protein
VSIEAQMAIVEKLHRLTGDAIAGLRADLDAAAARVEEAAAPALCEHGCEHPNDMIRRGMGGALPICTKCGCTVKEA